MKLFIKYPAYILLLILLVGSFDAFAQPVNLGGSSVNFMQPKEYVIGPILVEGVDDFDPNAIKLISGLKEGARVTVPGDDFSNGIKRLWEQKYFSDVQIYANKIVGNTIFLTIKLQGRKRLAGKFYDNVTKAKADKLEEVVTAQSGQLITETMIARTKRQIRGYYQEKGYYFFLCNIGSGFPIQKKQTNKEI